MPVEQPEHQYHFKWTTSFACSNQSAPNGTVCCNYDNSNFLRALNGGARNRNMKKDTRSTCSLSQSSCPSTGTWRKILDPHALLLNPPVLQPWECIHTLATPLCPRTLLPPITHNKNLTPSNIDVINVAILKGVVAFMWIQTISQQWPPIAFPLAIVPRSILMMGLRWSWLEEHQWMIVMIVILHKIANAFMRNCLFATNVCIYRTMTQDPTDFLYGWTIGTPPASFANQRRSLLSRSQTAENRKCHLFGQALVVRIQTVS